MAHVTSIVGIVGGIGGLVTLLFLRRQSGLEIKDSARDEAESLAKTRGMLIADLQRQLNSFRIEVDGLRNEVAAARREVIVVQRESHETQRMLLIGFQNVLSRLLDHISASPVEVDAAIRLLRDTLSDSPIRLNG